MWQKKRSRRDFSERPRLTAEACCVSMSIVSRVCTEEKEGNEYGTDEVFPSPRNDTQIPYSATNKKDFQRYVLRRNVFEYYDKGNSLLSKITPTLRERTAYKHSVNILIIYSYENVQLCSYAVRSHISFITPLLLLLLHTRVRNDTLTTPRQLHIGRRQT
jgi:hypothetical protein